MAADAPFPHDFLDGARGVQLAELAMTSWRERRWIDVPEISPTANSDDGVIDSAQIRQNPHGRQGKALAEPDHDGQLERGRSGGRLRAPWRAVDCAVAAQDRGGWP